MFISWLLTFQKWKAYECQVIGFCSFYSPNGLKQIPVIAYKNDVFTLLRLCQ